MRISILAVALATLAFAATAQQIYKWTDKDGRVHYGEKPPEDVKSNEVKVQTGGSGAPTEDAQSWKQKEVEFQKRKQERDKVDHAAGDADKAAERRKKLCENARGELQFVSSGVLYENNDKGERVYLTEAQRAQRIERAKQKIAANC